MELGDKILKLRKQNGLSQEELGEKLNVTRQTISNWELKETLPNVEQVKLLAKELNVSTLELLSDEDNKNISKKEDKQNKFSMVLKYIGMFFCNIFVGLGFILLYLWSLCMVLFSIASFVIAICLLFRSDLNGIIPYMPYKGALCMFISLISLSALFILSDFLYLSFVNNLLHFYINFNYKVLNKESKKEDKTNKIIDNKKVLTNVKVFLIIFILMFMISFIICMIEANNFAFWHVWSWWR